MGFNVVLFPRSEFNLFVVVPVHFVFEGAF